MYNIINTNYFWKPKSTYIYIYIYIYIYTYIIRERQKMLGLIGCDRPIYLFSLNALENVTHFNIYYESRHRHLTLGKECRYFYRLYRNLIMQALVQFFLPFPKFLYAYAFHGILKSSSWVTNFLAKTNSNIKSWWAGLILGDRIIPSFSTNTAQKNYHPWHSKSVVN